MKHKMHNKKITCENLNIDKSGYFFSFSKYVSVYFSKRKTQQHCYVFPHKKRAGIKPGSSVLEVDEMSTAPHCKGYGLLRPSYILTIQNFGFEDERYK
jgi:hypothetical protein